MAKSSAGILFYRFVNAELQLLLVHPGGPYWAKKEIGAWSIPKGVIENGEEARDAAIREVKEELGVSFSGKLIPLTKVKQKSGKTVHAWAVKADIEADSIRSNKIEIEWPPKSGNRISIPEVDKVIWFSIAEAKKMINPAQLSFIDEVKTLNDKSLI